MTIEADEAAIAAAKTRAREAIKQLAVHEAAAQAARVARDDAIHEMADHGRSAPDIGRDLGIPVSTVRQSIRMAIVRSAS